jgi:hypothetical protein
MISSQIPIKAATITVWNALIQDQHLLCFNPFVKKQDEGLVKAVGYKDSCEYYNGRKLTREVIDFKEGKKIKYRINFEGQNHNNYTTFEALEKNGVPFFKLTMESDGYRKVPRPIWHLVAYFLIIPSYKKYLNAVAKGMMYYCETGNKVKKNQFGSHNMFSKK